MLWRWSAIAMSLLFIYVGTQWCIKRHEKTMFQTSHRGEVFSSFLRGRLIGNYRTRRLRNEYNVCDVGRYTIIQQRLCYIIIICLRFRFISSDSRVYRVANNHGHLFMYTNNNNILYIIFIYTIYMYECYAYRRPEHNIIYYHLLYYDIIKYE